MTLTMEDLSAIEAIVRNVINEKRTRTAPKKVETYPAMKEFWMQRYPEYIFRAADGSALLQIQRALKKSFPEASQETICHTWRFMLMNLPEWYKDKSLQIINGKYNDILAEIRRSTPDNKSTKDYFDSKYGNPV